MMLSRISRVVGLAVLIAILTSCSIFRHSIDPSLKSAPLKLKYAGFQTFPTLRTFDGPGTVLRLDREGEHYVGTLRLPVECAGAEVFPEVRYDGSNFVAGILRFFGATDSVALLHRRHPSAYVGLYGCERYRMTDYSRTVAARRIADSLSVDLSLSGNYYLIREVVVVDSVCIRIISASSDSAVVARRSVGGIELSRAGNTGVLLARRLSPPHNIFFRADRILPRSGLQSVPRVTLVPVEDADSLPW